MTEICVSSPQLASSIRHGKADYEPLVDTRRVLRNCESTMTTDFMRHVRHTVWNRQMFLTKEKNFLCLGPSNSHSSLTIQENDVIFVLQGCSVPVILRPHPPPGDYYSLVGECYVHGIMDGEAFAEYQNEGWALSEVWIR
jgi:hypothetical protein